MSVQFSSRNRPLDEDAADQYRFRDSADAELLDASLGQSPSSSSSSTRDSHSGYLSRSGDGDISTCQALPHHHHVLSVTQYHHRYRLLVADDTEKGAVQCDGSQLNADNSESVSTAKSTTPTLLGNR